MVAYSAATGKPLWQRSAGIAPGLPGRAALVITPDGRTVVVAATSHAAHDKPRSYLTIGYNAASGAQRWARAYGGSRQNSSVAALGLSPSGRTIYVTGLSQNPPANITVFATIAYNAVTGATAWARIDRAAPAPNQAGIAVGRSGMVYLIGTLVATVAYSPAGRQVWSRRVGSRSSMTTVASSVVVSPASGDVYVTGFTGGQSTRSENYLTVARRG
ncbi:MAG: outer membrane protein assembly factor BamB family protein [Streptosporangiaceae bacterium]